MEKVTSLDLKFGSKHSLVDIINNKWYIYFVLKSVSSILDFYK